MTNPSQGVPGDRSGNDSLRVALGAGRGEAADAAKARSSGKLPPILTLDTIDRDGTRQPLGQSQSSQDLSSPANLPMAAIILLVEQLSLKMTEKTADQAQTSLELDQKAQDAKTEAINDKMEAFYAKVEKMKKKAKMFKALKQGVEIAGVVASVASLGSFAGPVAMTMGMFSCGINATMAGLDLSGKMDEFAEKNPKSAAAVQVSAMVMQVGLMGGAAFATKAFQKAAEESAAATADLATDGAARVGEKAAANATEEASSVATAKAASVEGLQGTSADMEAVEEVEDNAVAAKAVNKLSKLKEGQATEEADDVLESTDEGFDETTNKLSKLRKGRATDEVDDVLENTDEGLEETTAASRGDKELQAKRVEKLAKILGRAAGFTQVAGSVTAAVLQGENAALAKEQYDEQADLTELKSDMKVIKQMIDVWLSKYQSISEDYQKTVERTWRMRTSVVQPNIDISKAADLTV